MRNKDGTFAEGVSGNPKGKPKGAISEKTRVWNEISEWFKGEGIEAYQEELMKMKGEKPDEFMKRFETMLEYFQPKLSRTDLDLKSDGEKINIPISEWSKKQK
jgi:hypothetical protein